MLLATFLLGAFIIHSVIKKDADDDDGPGGGIMQPVYIPTP
tara:strand:+ start:32 stop:154 length:123 start_codon:yes stop_codon:yes gene_type:complete